MSASRRSIAPPMPGAAGRAGSRSARESRGANGPSAWRAAIAVLVVALSLTAGASARAQTYRLGPGGIVTGASVSSGSNSVLTSMPGDIGGETGGSQRVYGGLVALAVGATFFAAVTPPTTTPYGQATTISATVQCPLGAPTPALCFRLGGSTSFQSNALSEVGPLYQGTIPAPSVTERGIEYYLRASVGPVTLTYPPRDANASPATIGVTLTNFTGRGGLATKARTYRMVSFPATLTDGTPAGIFADDLGAQSVKDWRLGRWNPADSSYDEYTSSTSLGPIVAGDAYWLVTDGAKTVDFDGSSQPRPASGFVPLRLKPGWNQIADPFAFDVALGTLDVVVDGQHYSPATAFANGWLENTPLHEYDGTGFPPSAGLAPWTGYFVKNLHSRDLTLNVPYAESALSFPATEPARAETPPWLVHLAVSDELGARGQAEFAMLDEAADGLDANDALAPPPPPGQPLQLVSLSPTASGAVERLARDVRPRGQDGGATWDLRVRSGARGSIRLRASLSGELPTGTRVELIDPIARRHVDPLQEGYEVLATAPDQELHLVLAVGSETFVANASSHLAAPGLDFALRPVAPDPARGPVFVQFAVPRDGEARVQVLDVSGREVATLAAGLHQAGLHTVRWDSGVAPAGVYYLRLESQGRQQSRKFVLLR